MDVPVLAFPVKMGMSGKGISSRMLEYQQAAFPKQAAGNFRSIEDFVRDSVQSVNIIRGIGKDNVKIQLADIQEIEYIVTDYMHSLYIKRCCRPLYKRSVKRVHLH